MKKNTPLDLLSRREYVESEDEFHSSRQQGDRHEEMVIINDAVHREIIIHHRCWSNYNDSQETYVIPHERLTHPLVLGRNDGSGDEYSTARKGREIAFTRDSVDFLRAVAEGRGRRFLAAALQETVVMRARSLT